LKYFAVQKTKNPCINSVSQPVYNSSTFFKFFKSCANKIMKIVMIFKWFWLWVCHSSVSLKLVWQEHKRVERHSKDAGQNWMWQRALFEALIRTICPPLDMAMSVCFFVCCISNETKMSFGPRYIEVKVEEHWFIIYTNNIKINYFKIENKNLCFLVWLNLLVLKGLRLQKGSKTTKKIIFSIH